MDIGFQTKKVRQRSNDNSSWWSWSTACNGAHWCTLQEHVSRIRSPKLPIQPPSTWANGNIKICLSFATIIIRRIAINTIIVMITFRTEPGTREGFLRPQCKHLFHSQSPRTPSMDCSHICLCISVTRSLTSPCVSWNLSPTPGFFWLSACFKAALHCEAGTSGTSTYQTMLSIINNQFLQHDYLPYWANLMLDELEWSRELILSPASCPASKRGWLRTM